MTHLFVGGYPIHVHPGRMASGFALRPAGNGSAYLMGPPRELSGSLGGQTTCRSVSVRHSTHSGTGRGLSKTQPGAMCIPSHTLQIGCHCPEEGPGLTEEATVEQQLVLGATGWVGARG